MPKTKEAPRHAVQFKYKRLARFKKWVEARGGEILTPTNEWEVLRFTARGETSIVYRNKHGTLTYCGMAEELVIAFQNGETPDLATVERVGRIKRSKRTARVKALIERDGFECWFCGEELSDHTVTVEELVARASGGPIHIHNQVLACQPCNTKVSNLPVALKVIYRDKRRGHVRTLVFEPGESKAEKGAEGTAES
jgi:hypothetical protein